MNAHRRIKLSPAMQQLEEHLKLLPQDVMCGIYPVVPATRSWVTPLLDMPIRIDVALTPEQKAQIDMLRSKMRQRDKALAFAFNYNPDNLNHKEIK